MDEGEGYQYDAIGPIGDIYKPYPRPLSTVQHTTCTDNYPEITTNFAIEVLTIFEKENKRNKKLCLRYC